MMVEVCFLFFFGFKYNSFVIYVFSILRFKKGGITDSRVNVAK